MYNPQNVFAYQGNHGKPISTLDASLRNLFPNILDEQMTRISRKETPPVEWRKEKTMNDSLWFIYTSGTTGLPKAAKVSIIYLYKH